MQAVCSECHMPNSPGSEICSNCTRPLVGGLLVGELLVGGPPAAEPASPSAQPQPGPQQARGGVNQWLISGAVFLGICLFGLATSILVRPSALASREAATGVTVTQALAAQGSDPTPQPSPTTWPADTPQPPALSAPGDTSVPEAAPAAANQEPVAASPAEPVGSPEPETAPTTASHEPVAASPAEPVGSPEPGAAPTTASQEPVAASSAEHVGSPEPRTAPATASQEPVAASSTEPASSPEPGAAPATASQEPETASSAQPAGSPEPESVPATPTPSPMPPPTDTPEPTRTPKPAPPPAKKPKVRPAVVPTGEQVRADTWLFTVTGVQWHRTLRWQEWSREAKGVWAVLLLDIENQAAGTTSFRMLRWELHGGQGAVYDESSTYYAAWQFNGRETAYTELAPGQRAQIVMAFDVAEGVKGLTLYSDRLARGIVHIGDAQPAQGP